MMEIPSKKIQEFIITAINEGVEITLDELVDIMDFKDHSLILDQIQRVQTFLEGWNLHILPPLTTGDFDTIRIIKSIRKPTYSEVSILAEIQNHESSCLELKSSLLYDHSIALDVPETKLRDLRSDLVLYSVLKTVAAFLNSGGGVLYIGIDDDGFAKDLKYDCMLLGCNEFDADKWQLELRNHITGKFKDGMSLNDYLEVHFTKKDGIDIARIQVHGRSRLTFLKQGGIYKLYRRQGNRTTEVLIEEIEEFYENRNKIGA